MSDEIFTEAERLLTKFYAATTEDEAEDCFVRFDAHIRDQLRGWAWFRLGRWAQADRDGRADDVAQGVLIRVWRTWEKRHTRWSAEKGRLRAWLSPLVSRTITGLHRCDERFGALPSSQLTSPEEVGPDLTVQARDGDPADEAALAELIDSFLNSLSEADRTLFELKMHEDLTQGEIARQLGVSDAVVSQRLKGLRRQLSVILGLNR